MKEMFTQREQHFSELVVEREQEIERLKSIIKTLTKAQEVEERASPKTSRNKESINR
jgi:dihydropteroate synthase